MSGIMCVMLGASQELVTLGFDANFLMTSNGNSPSFKQASFSLLSNTTASASAVNVITAATRWATPTTAGIGDLYEARLEVSSIVTTIDPTQIQFAGVDVTAVGNTPYYALSSTRSLVVTAYTNPQVGNSDFAQCIGTVRVRSIINPAISATATFSLTANADF